MLYTPKLYGFVSVGETQNKTNMEQISCPCPFNENDEKYRKFDSIIAKDE